MLGNERAYREKPAYGIIKRLRRKLLSVFNLWHREGYDVRYAFINGKQYKKVIFSTEAASDRVYGDLKAFGTSRHFPAVIGKRQSTLWVEFVQGSTIRNVDTHILALLADFYATIYKREPRLAAIGETTIWHDFLQDSCFLRDVKILSDRLYRELIDHSDEIVPAMVWLGFDYTDPITANLVLRKDEDVICAIDIKNLHSEALIGRGIAKARSRWLSDALVGPFFEQLALKGAPDFRIYLPVLEILNQVKRAKNIVLKGQIKSLSPAELDQHLERLLPQARAACPKWSRPASGDHARIDRSTGRPAQRP